MADQVYGILHSNGHPVSGDEYQWVAPDDESFLREVIAPIYNVLRKVCSFSVDASSSCLPCQDLKIELHG